MKWFFKSLQTTEIDIVIDSNTTADSMTNVIELTDSMTNVIVIPLQTV